MTLANAHISPEARARVLGWLEQSQREFFAAIDDVSDAQWAWKPAQERWSVAETAEHIVVAEGLLFQVVQRALEGPPNARWQEETTGKTELLVQVLPSGEGQAVAPAPFRPRERLTRDQIKDRLASQRIDIVRFASGTDVPLRAFTRVHPFPEFGTLNAYQWLIYVPLHTLRHSKQIAELKATPGFPAR